MDREVHHRQARDKKSYGFAIILTAMGMLCPIASADIFQWEWVDPNNHSLGKQQSPTVAPEGTGLAIGPAPLNVGAFSPYYWSEKNLSQAYLIGADLTNIRAFQTNLTNADLSSANLSGMIMIGATLTGANFHNASIDTAAFSPSRTHLSNTTATGFTQFQLYDTASYQANTLANVALRSNNMTGWNFAGQNLFGTDFTGSTLLNADFGNAIVAAGQFTGSAAGTNFSATTALGFSAVQLYSTASYQAHNLWRIDLSNNDLSGWDFTNQNIRSANFAGSTLTAADFTGARFDGAAPDFSDTTSRGFTKEQLYSTASYAAHERLLSIKLASNDLSGWDFKNQNLLGVVLSQSNLSNTNFTGANLTAVDLDGATGFTLQQFYSSLNYQQTRYFPYSRFGQQNFSGGHFSGLFFTASSFISTNLQNANFNNASLHDVDFTDANLVGADFTGADLRGTYGFDTPALLTRNAILPDATIESLNLLDDDELTIREYGGYSSPAGIHVLEGMHIHAGGVISFALGAYGWDDTYGSTLHFTAYDPVVLSGTLNLLFNYPSGLGYGDTINPEGLVGTSWRLFDWTGVTPSGTFDQIITPAGTIWDTSALYTTGFVTLHPSQSRR